MWLVSIKTAKGEGEGEIAEKLCLKNETLAKDMEIRDTNTTRAFSGLELEVPQCIPVSQKVFILYKRISLCFTEKAQYILQKPGVSVFHLASL